MVSKLFLLFLACLIGTGSSLEVETLGRSASLGHDITPSGSYPEAGSTLPMVQIVQDEAVVTKQQNYDSQQSRGAATVSNQAIIQSFQRALTSLESARQALLALANLYQQQQTCPDTCDQTRWKKCTCASPAVFDNQGRGNCNFGATKLDTKVWCYIDSRGGDPRALCPDAQTSQSKPGYYWSRYACIT